MKYQRNAGEPPENRRKTAGELPRGEQEQKIYRYVLENAYITRAQVMTLLDLKQRRAREILFNMIEDGWLRKEALQEVRFTCLIQQKSNFSINIKVRAVDSAIMKNVKRELTIEKNYGQLSFFCILQRFLCCL